MIARHLLNGFRSARRQWRLVVLLWVLNVALALVVVLPVWRWIRPRLGASPEAARMTGGLDVTVLADLIETHPDVLPVIFAAAFTMALLTALASILVSGGVLEVLLSARRARLRNLQNPSLPVSTAVASATPAVLAPVGEDVTTRQPAVVVPNEPAAAAGTVGARDAWAEPPSAGESDLAPGDTLITAQPGIDLERGAVRSDASSAATRNDLLPVRVPPPAGVTTSGEWPRVEGRAVLTRFFAGAGHFFWRNLRLTLLTAVLAGIVIGVTVSLLRALTLPLGPTNSELGDWFVTLLPLVGGALVLLAFLLILDFARVGLVATDDRRVRSVWWASVRLLFRHGWRLAAVWLAAAVLVVLGFGLYLLLASPLNGTSWLLIVLLFLLQQLFVLWRASVRVALAAAQVDQAIALGLAGLGRG